MGDVRAAARWRAADSDARMDDVEILAASAVMFRRGGADWRAWNRRLKPMLVDTQRLRGEARGSWDGGLRPTVLRALTLQVYYRYRMALR